VDNDIQAIVVSEETLKGGEAVNEKRKVKFVRRKLLKYLFQEKGLNHLNVHVIKLLECEILQDNILNEVKISSSAQRRQILGTLLRKPTYENMPISKTHYVIGLTGGIASGKTHISKYLESQGCEVINTYLLLFAYLSF
jgi:phosphopantetheine adenylyltransferase/dephospho-CoA kinase